MGKRNVAKSKKEPIAQYFSDQVIIDEPPAVFVARLASVLAPFKYTLASQTDKLVVFNKSTSDVPSLVVFGALGLASRKHSTISLAFSEPNDTGQRTMFVESDNPKVSELFEKFDRLPQT